jgi:hypothetical protein
VDWAKYLRGRSGVGMSLAPLSHQEITAWQNLMQIEELDPLEVYALLVLDAAIGDDEPEKEEPVKLVASAAWPQRKPGA